MNNQEKRSRRNVRIVNRFATPVAIVGYLVFRNGGER